MLTLKSDRFKPESDSKNWWQPLSEEVELFIEVEAGPPNAEEMQLAENAVQKIDELTIQALNYIDIWVDRTREGTGTEYWVSGIYVYPHTRRGGQTKIQFGFPADQDSIWWVLFNNPTPPFPGGKPRYHPVAFGRNQG